jgi:DNA-binding transcriptional ArsR family regulator
MNTTAEFQAEILNAIAHPNRIRILEKIRSGINCNCEIAPELELEQSNLSRHLKILVKSGILRSWKEGLRTNYEITDELIYDLLELASEIAKSNLEKKLNTFEIR